MAGHVLHRRFEGRLRTDPGARRSFYGRLLVLEWGLALLALVVWLAAPGVDAAAVGLRWPRSWPGPLTGAARRRSCWSSSSPPPGRCAAARCWRRRRRRPAGRPGEGRHAEPPGHATLALLPRTAGERRLFTVVGLTAGVCEEWLYRGFFLAVVAAVAGGLPTWVLVAGRRGRLRAGARLPGPGRASCTPACSAA